VSQMEIKCKKKKEKITLSVLTAERMKELMSICPICDGPIGGGCSARITVGNNKKHSDDYCARRDG
jgi:hypothetical protein